MVFVGELKAAGCVSLLGVLLRLGVGSALFLLFHNNTNGLESTPQSTAHIVSCYLNNVTNYILKNKLAYYFVVKMYQTLD